MVYINLSPFRCLMFLPTDSKKIKRKQTEKPVVRAKMYLLISTMLLEIIQDYYFFLDLAHIHLKTHG